MSLVVGIAVVKMSPLVVGIAAVDVTPCCWHCCCRSHGAHGKALFNIRALLMEGSSFLWEKNYLNRGTLG